MAKAKIKKTATVKGHVPAPPNELLNRISDNKCAVFVGAGLSQGAGFPGWAQFLDQLVDRCHTKHLIDKAHADELKAMLAGADSQTLLMVAQELSDGFTRPSFVKEIANIFKNTAIRPTATHEQLPKTPFRLVITTNYDKLIENAYSVALKSVPPIYTHVNPGGIADALSDDEFCILKAHGTVDDAENIVITQKDYRSIIFHSEGYRAALGAIFTTMSVFFVGVSLQDPEVQLLLSYLHDAFHGRGSSHFALLPEQKSTKTFLSRWQKDYKVEAIYYKPSAGHPEVLEFLKSLP